MELELKRMKTYYQKLVNMNDSNGIYQVDYCYYLGIEVEIDKLKASIYYLRNFIVIVFKLR